MNWPLFHRRRRRRSHRPLLRKPRYGATPSVILFGWPRVALGPRQPPSALSPARLYRTYHRTVSTWPQMHLTSLASPTTIANAATRLLGHHRSVPSEVSPARAPCPLLTAGQPLAPQSITAPLSRLPVYPIASPVAGVALVVPPRPACAPSTPLPVTCSTWAPFAWRPSLTVMRKRSIAHAVHHHPLVPECIRHPATGATTEDTITMRPQLLTARFPFDPILSVAFDAFARLPFSRSRILGRPLTSPYYHTRPAEFQPLFL